MATYSGISSAQLVRGSTTVTLHNIEEVEVSEVEGRTLSDLGDDAVGEAFADVVDRQRRWSVRLRDLSDAASAQQGAWDSLSFTVAGLGDASDLTYTLAGGGVVVERIAHEHRHGRPSVAVLSGRALFDGATDPLSVEST